MAARIRVLDSANRPMQRLGYLKLLCSMVNDTDTSNLRSLGGRLISRLSQRVKRSPPFGADLQDYAKTRLTDGAYRELRKTILGDSGPAGIEIQDIYLADSTLPSCTGKLIDSDGQRYPYLGTALDLIKKGTYSPMTRSLVLLAVTPNEELRAFSELDQQHNPLHICDAQAAIFLYCLIDNDAEVVVRLYRKLAEYGDEPFGERQAGDMLPGILREVASLHRKRSLTVEQRDRLALLEKVSDTIEKWKDRSYSGGSAREVAIRVRLEPYCDLGLLRKPAREKYEYNMTERGRAFFRKCGDPQDIDKFLEERFFAAFAACRGIKTRKATDGQATKALTEAGEALKSSLGYTPITDVGLLAGTRLLTEKKRILELTRTVDLLKGLQKQDPHFVRFTVDRMGALAYVKFLKNAPGA